MATNKKAYKPLEKTQLNRIAEEQEMKQCKRSGDNIASLLRRRALLPNPGLGMKGSRGQFSVKKKKSSLACPESFLVCDSESENHECISPLKEELKVAPLRAQSVQNISKVPSSAAQCSTRTAGSKKKHSEETIKRAFSAHNVAMANTSSKASKQILNSKAVAYNAELLMKFDAEKKVLDSKICELTELSEMRRIDLENLRKKLEEERESQRRGQQGDGEIMSQLDNMKAENEALKKQLKENGISVEHFTDTEKLFLISNIDPHFVDVSVLESSDDLRVSTDDISAIAQRYVSSAIDDVTNLDRHNSMSVDRGLNAVSIADLTDRFLQMQEAQHSVDEELQATLQELSDLQENVTELNEANESLKSDNEILLGSLCGTSEKLENARIQVENLKSLLIRDIERCDNNDRELQLTGLLKCAQQEKDELLRKQMECLKVISSLESENREMRDAMSVLKESVHLEVERNKTLKDENNSLRLQFEHPHHIIARDFNVDTTSSSSPSSFVRLDNLLKQKEVELERIKKMNIETVRELKQQNEFLKEKVVLQSQHNKELDRELKSLSASLRQSKAELSGCKKNLSEEREEWAQFQSDLLTAVVVANNLNMEKDNELKRLKLQQKEVQEKYQHLIEHISSKGFPDGQVAQDFVNGNEKGDDESAHGVEAFLHIGFPPAVAKDVANRTSMDVSTTSSKETNNFNLPTNQSLATSVKNLADALPFIGLVRSPTNGYSGVTCDDASTIPGILMKNHNSERRDEKDKSCLTATPSYLSQMLRSDPLMGLVKSGGSKRNALLTWCQNKLKDFEDIEVTNFSSSWNDGLALCALLNTYLPHDIPYSNLKNLNVKQRFQRAFDVSKEAGLELGSEDDLNDLVASDRPAWQMVFGLVANIYKHFEVDSEQHPDMRRNSLHQR